MTTIDKELEKEFFDTLDEKLSKADIAFKAYEKGYNDAMSVIKDVKSEIEQRRDYAETQYGHQLGFDKIYAYTTCLEIIDKHLADMRGEL